MKAKSRPREKRFWVPELEKRAKVELLMKRTGQITGIMSTEETRFS